MNLLISPGAILRFKIVPFVFDSTCAELEGYIQMVEMGNSYLILESISNKVGLNIRIFWTN